MRCTLLYLLLLLNIVVSSQDFQDVTALQNIDHTFINHDNFFGGGVSLVDFDGDGWDDLTLASHLGDSLYFYKNQSGTYVRVYHDGLESTCYAKQVLWVDIDNDGDMDFYLTCHAQGNRLFENTGGMNFQDITMDAGLDLIAEHTFGASFGDIDKDGDLDLLILNRWLIDPERNIILYENQGNNTFSNITLSAGLEIGTAPFVSVFTDYNTDGWPDILIAMDKYEGNFLFENNGDNTFTDVSAVTGMDHALDAMCVAPGDYDNDDDIDYYITNTPLEGNHLFTNNGNGFFDETAAAANLVVDGYDWGSNFFDVENDGDLDLYISGILTINAVPNSHLYINDGSGNFSVSIPPMPNDDYQSYSNAIGDFDKDGYPDIAVNNYDGTPSKLWRNMRGENKTGGNWIKIRLHGIQSNINGYGTKLEVYSDGSKQLRYTYCGEGFLAQNATHEIFGLGTATLVDSIVVTWLSGVVDVLYNEAVNHEILVTEGGLPTGISDDTELVSQFHTDETGQLFFSLTRKEVTNFQVSILMIDGRELINRQYVDAMPNQRYEMNIENYPPGVYVFSISANGKVWSQTFILH